MNNKKLLLLLMSNFLYLINIVLLITTIVLWNKYSDVCDVFLGSASVVGASYAGICKNGTQVKHARELLEKEVEDAKIKGWEDYVLWATPVKQKFHKKVLETFEKKVHCQATPQKTAAE